MLKHTIALALVLAMALAFAGGAARTSAEGASTFTVNSPADVPDFAPGNGVCETGAGNGTCTLRAAIQEANALAGADIINIPAITVTLTRAGNDDTALHGDLDINSDLTIDGAGSGASFIEGNGATTNDRVFHILPGARATIRDVFVQNGRAYSSAVAYGGNIYVAATGQLTLTNVWVSKGQADYGGGIFNGGALVLNVALFGDGLASHDGAGIFNAGTLTADNAYVFYNTARAAGAGLYNGGGGRANLSNSYIYNNYATSVGGVISTSGGAVYNAAALTLTATALSYNGSDLGAGIYNGTSASLALSNTLIVGNAANSNGGGLLNFGTARAAGSLFKVNTAGLRGGGIYNGGASGGTVQLTNSTLSGNRSDEAGGGLYNFSGSANLYNATVASNVADDNNDDASDGGGIKQVGGTVMIRNTILANNVHRIPIFPYAISDDCKGALNSEGYNLIESITGCAVGGVLTGNLSGQDPQLAALADNGGPTETHALKPASIARDAGNPSGCTDPLGAVLKIDQRGKWRPSDGDGDGVKRCDIGAYEALVEVFLPLIRR